MWKRIDIQNMRRSNSMYELLAKIPSEHILDDELRPKWAEGRLAQGELRTILDQLGDTLMDEAVPGQDE